MTESEPKRGAGASAAAGKEVVAEAELLRLAGIDAARFAALSDFEQRLTLKMAEKLVNAASQARPPK